MFTGEEVAKLLESDRAEALRQVQHIQDGLLDLSQRLHDYATTIIIDSNSVALREAIQDDWYTECP